jgi:hypothetical protein
VHDVELHFLARCLQRNRFGSGEQSFLSDVFHTTDKDTSTEERLDVDEDGMKRWSDGVKRSPGRFIISSSVDSGLRLAMSKLKAQGEINGPLSQFFFWCTGKYTHT